MGAVATAAVNPFVTETTTELLRTIAGVLDVKSVFPRISNIVQQVVPHDALGLRFRDRTGRATLEARSTDELPEHGWCTNQEEKEYTIASDRISDVPLLAEQFLADVGGALSGPPARLSDRARKALLAYGWPGNIRELRNVLESAAILSDEGVIEPHHLSLPAKERPYASPHDLVTIERQTIQNVLRETDWNKAKAARLGLTRQAAVRADATIWHRPSRGYLNVDTSPSRTHAAHSQSSARTHIACADAIFGRIPRFTRGALVASFRR